MRTIELTRDEFATLLLMLGYATGAAFAKGERDLGYRFVALANQINKDNPNWTAYEIPPDVQSPIGKDAGK